MNIQVEQRVVMTCHHKVVILILFGDQFDSIESDESAGDHDAIRNRRCDDHPLAIPGQHNRAAFGGTRLVQADCIVLISPAGNEQDLPALKPLRRFCQSLPGSLRTIALRFITALRIHIATHEIGGGDRC